jgi:hypothetical protein
MGSQGAVASARSIGREADVLGVGLGTRATAKSSRMYAAVCRTSCGCVAEGGGQWGRPRAPLRVPRPVHRVGSGTRRPHFFMTAIADTVGVLDGRD